MLPVQKARCSRHFCFFKILIPITKFAWSDVMRPKTFQTLFLNCSYPSTSNVTCRFGGVKMVAEEGAGVPGGRREIRL